MAKKKKEVIKPMAPEQKKIQEDILSQVMDLKLDSLYNIERQDTNYGKNKSHSWNDVNYNVKDARIHVEQGMMNEVPIVSNRIFDQSGYSIEVRSFMEMGKTPGEAAVGATIIGLSNSTERDENGYIKHDDNTKEAYIRLNGSNVQLLSNDQSLKRDPITEVPLATSESSFFILNGKDQAIKNLEIKPEEWIEKLEKKLAEVDPKFPELFEALVSNREKEFVDAQPDNTTVLQDLSNKKKEQMNAALNESVTTEKINKSKGFFNKLLGKDKEKDKGMDSKER